MSGQVLRAVIIGIPHIPTVVKVNVRRGPGTSEALAFESPLGVDAVVEAVQPDATNAGRDGRIYQWFQLRFPNGELGWVRDDLIEIYGDGNAYGYGIVHARTLAFSLPRRPVTTPTPAPVVAPAQPVVPPAPAQPVAPQPATPTPPVVGGQPMAICRAKTGVNMRSGAGTNYNPPIGRMNFNDRGRILGAKRDETGIRLQWVNVEVNGLRGWVREDFLRLEGDPSAFGLGYPDQYPCPMPDSWWVRDYNYNPVDPKLGFEHWGWDFGANVGTPIYAGPQGGSVVQTMRCTRCTPSHPSTLSQGLSLGDPRVFSDPAWGFGYGHFVVVRYDHDKLPDSTRRILAERNLAGAHLFALYGHLHDFSVQTGQIVMPNAVIGTCGNTGNSEAAHLHLELRAGRNPAANWSALRADILDPIVLFMR